MDTIYNDRKKCNPIWHFGVFMEDVAKKMFESQMHQMLFTSALSLELSCFRSREAESCCSFVRCKGASYSERFWLSSFFLFDFVFFDIFWFLSKKIVSMDMAKNISVKLQNTPLKILRPYGLASAKEYQWVEKHPGFCLTWFLTPLR